MAPGRAAHQPAPAAPARGLAAAALVPRAPPEPGDDAVLAPRLLPCCGPPLPEPVRAAIEGAWESASAGALPPYPGDAVMPVARL